MITQVLYAIVFCTRYLDLFQKQLKWNLFFKIFYITSSFYTIGIMRWIYPRTREKELAWKMGAVCLAGSLLLSPFVMLIFEGKHVWSFVIVRLRTPHSLPHTVIGQTELTGHSSTVALGLLADP